MFSAACRLETRREEEEEEDDAEALSLQRRGAKGAASAASRLRPFIRR